MHFYCFSFIFFKNFIEKFKKIYHFLKVNVHFLKFFDKKDKPLSCMPLISCFSYDSALSLPKKDSLSLFFVFYGKKASVRAVAPFAAI